MLKLMADVAEPRVALMEFNLVVALVPLPLTVAAEMSTIPEMVTED